MFDYRKDTLHQKSINRLIKINLISSLVLVGFIISIANYIVLRFSGFPAHRYDFISSSLERFEWFISIICAGCVIADAERNKRLAFPTNNSLIITETVAGVVAA